MFKNVYFQKCTFKNIYFRAKRRNRSLSQLFSTDIIWHLEPLIIIHPNKTPSSPLIPPSAPQDLSDSSDMCLYIHPDLHTRWETWTNLTESWSCVNRLNLNYTATQTHLELERYGFFSGWWRYLVKQEWVMVNILPWILYKQSIIISE